MFIFYMNNKNKIYSRSDFSLPNQALGILLFYRIGKDSFFPKNDTDNPS